MPAPVPGLQIDRDEALAEETVAGPMAAVIVAGRKFHRQIGEAELFIDGNLPPHAGVAGVGPRILFPGVVAEFARTGNRMEDPKALAGVYVEPAHVALLVAAA